ncbi:MAG: hypothetical protein KDH19_17650 [Geminicoccaceae bacterium]|nr:hypothetical protein [Geminicoccaceae bacterium]MCB2012345.1 hypothetical protein [Geminicoccaceae bacterium]
MTSLVTIQADAEISTKSENRIEMEERQPLRELHLVRVDDSEFYFFELEGALRKLYEVPDASLERITVH